MERPRPVTVVALVAMVALQLLYGLARLAAGQAWGGRPFLLLSLPALGLAGLAQTVAFASWALVTGSRAWTAVCLLLAALGLVPAVALAHRWLGPG